MPARHDAFDEAYGQGVPGALRPAAGGSLGDGGPPAGGPTPAGAILAEPVALGGSVLRGDGTMARGWVVVEGERIVSVTSTKPRDVASCDRHRRRDPAGPHRPARPPGVQRLRRVGAAQAIHQPGSVAEQPRVRQAGQAAVARR